MPHIDLHHTIGLAKTNVDAHTLGLVTVNELLTESGFTTLVADEKISQAFADPQSINNSSRIRRWITENRIGILGFSYRLDPENAITIFNKLMYQLKSFKTFNEDGGPLKAVCFSGLPEATERIRRRYGENVEVFYGDETPKETLIKMKINPDLAPPGIVGTHPYDEIREEFGKYIISKGDFSFVKPSDRSKYPGFGTEKDSLVNRIHFIQQANQHPIIRAHAGPYDSDRDYAVKKFLSWAKELASAGFLDVLSIGPSQLSQSMFGKDWGKLPNGGGVPVNSPEEYHNIWKASRPMLVRTYAGTSNVRQLAEIYEKAINIVWHALSFWWFCELDGRGPQKLLDNLQEQFKTLEFIASTGKPYEANVPHHFAFRSSDDITFIVSTYLSAKIAKMFGIKCFIFQDMLNTPKYTWGINDIAKARASLALLRELEDPNFRVYFQTRAGLDYLSHDMEKAKVQLATVTALMDDIEPNNTNSPNIIHVVSYSEGRHLATPSIINESIQITLYALEKYRELKTRGDIDSVDNYSEVTNRTHELVSGAKTTISAIEQSIDNPYTPQGFFDIFQKGFLPVPNLWHNRDEFPEAVRWNTKIRFGRVDIYDNEGNRLSPHERMEQIIGGGYT